MPLTWGVLTQNCILLRLIFCFFLSLIQDCVSCSIIDEVHYGLKWFHDLAGQPNDCQLLLIIGICIVVPRGRSPFGQHQESRPRSGQVQRHSGFEWICKHNRLRPEPIRFVRLDSEHAQSDGKSLNRGLPVLDLARGRDSWC